MNNYYNTENGKYEIVYEIAKDWLIACNLHVVIKHSMQNS